MRRRDFLNLFGSAGLGLAVPMPLRGQDEQADPAPYEGPFFVVFNASGGWDTTYLMDPKGVNEINRLYQEHRRSARSRRARGSSPPSSRATN